MEFVRRLTQPSAPLPYRVGILAGSFNPPTVAHLHLLEAARPHVDELLCVLPRRFPHKAYHGASLDERVSLLSNTGLSVDFSIGVADGVVTVQGPNAVMHRNLPEGITLTQEGDVLTVDRASEETSQKSLHGLTRTLVANMVTGVTTGWTKELEIIGVGYRAATSDPAVLDLALGFSHPVKFNAPDGVTFEVPTPTRVIVKGADKEVVGQVAATIRKIRKPEPYKGKGVRYLGEKVLRKAGKAAK